MTRKRILFLVSSSTTYGGVHVRQARLASALPSEGWDAVFGVTWGQAFHCPERFQAAFPDLDCIRLDGRTGTEEGRILAIQHAIRKIQPDVVAPGFVADAYRALATMTPGERGRIRVIAGLYALEAEAALTLRAAASQVDQAVGVSGATVQVLREVAGFPDDRVHKVPTGVPTPVQRPAARRTSEVRLAYVGRFAQDKRPGDFLELCRLLKRGGMMIRGAMVGEGPLGAELASALRDDPGLGVELIPPMRPDALYRELYPCLDYCCLFSPAEGMPNALLETMAHGVVPVTADFLGRAREGVLRPGETAVVFPVAKVDLAARQIIELHHDPGARERIGVRARAYVEERHSIAAMTRAFANVLTHSLKLPPRAPTQQSAKGRSRNRLTRWLGPRAAELLRRGLRRYYHHPDGSEWPSSLPQTSAQLAEAQVRLRELLADGHGLNGASDGVAAWPSPGIDAYDVVPHQGVLGARST